MSRVFAAALVVIPFASTAVAQYNAIELGVLSRSGGQAGSEFDVRVLTGTRIDEIRELRFSDPRISAELATVDPLPLTEARLPKFGNFRVRIAADTPPGRYEVRGIGRHGISNPRLFLVSSYPDQTPTPISHLASAPTPLPRNQVSHAVTTAAQVDYYKLSMEAGQRVRVDLLAEQLDSCMIGQIKVIDPNGRIVVAGRGSDGMDPYLEFASQQAGDYLIAVNDFLFRGGNDFFYQVLARVGDEADRELIGTADAERWLIPESATLTESDPVAVEEATVQAVTPPCAIAATFDWRDDEDVYEFSASQGDQYVIEVVSSRIGQPTDARLVVLRGEPKPSAEIEFQQIANSDDSQSVGGVEMSLRSKDPILTLKAPATGTYRVVVRDLDTGESLGKTQGYRLLIRKPTPRVDLVAFMPYPHKDANLSRHFGSKLYRGGGEAIRVLAVRHDGWAGEIKLEVNGLPPGISCKPATMAANQTQMQLTLLGGQDAAGWAGPVEVIGTATINGQQQTIRAKPATFQWGKGYSRDFIQSRLCEELWIASTEELSPISIALGDGGTLEGKKKASLKLPILLTRQEGGKAVCVLRPRDLPPGVTAGEVNIPADKSEGTLELKITDKAATGTYSLWLQAETKIKVKPNPEILARAQQYRSHLQKLHDDPAQAANLDAIKKAIAAADAKVEAAKPHAKDQELTVYIPSPHVTIRVVDP